MTDAITTQLGGLLAISKEPDGQTALHNGMRGHVWILPGGAHVPPRVWERLWELGQLEYTEYDRGRDRPKLKLLRITKTGLERLEEAS